MIRHEKQTTAQVARVRELSENVAKAVTYVEEEPLISKYRSMKKETLKKFHFSWDMDKVALRKLDISIGQFDLNLFLPCGPNVSF